VVSTALEFLVAPRLRRADRVDLLGFQLEVQPGVFHPGLFFSSRILGGYLGTLPLTGKRVLDMGTGSGIQALVAARRGARVSALDLNPAAVECARRNLERNGLAKGAAVLESDLFSALPAEQQFDLIIWNPPFYPRPPRDAARQAWDAGPGYDVINRFAGESPAHLAPGGSIVLILSSDMDEELCLGFFRGCTVNPVLRKRRLFERLSVYEIKAG
jgi:release factor glutamine methyltransferase